MKKISTALLIMLALIVAGMEVNRMPITQDQNGKGNRNTNFSNERGWDGTPVQQPGRGGGYNGNKGGRPGRYSGPNTSGNRFNQQISLPPSRPVWMGPAAGAGASGTPAWLQSYINLFKPSDGDVSNFVGPNASGNRFNQQVPENVPADIPVGGNPNNLVPGSPEWLDSVRGGSRNFFQLLNNTSPDVLPSTVPDTGNGGGGGGRGGYGTRYKGWGGGGWGGGSYNSLPSWYLNLVNWNVK